MFAASRRAHAPWPSSVTACARTFPLWLAAVIAAAAACARPDQPSVQVIDLVRHFERADKRPVDGAFEVAELAIGEHVHPGLAVPATSRVHWKFQPLPRRARLRVWFGVPAGQAPARIYYRVGISDGRIYETLFEQTVETGAAPLGWLPVEVDLSRYAGPQWSIFYRPDARHWELILATSGLEGDRTVLYWGGPGIETDLTSARDYARR